MHFPCVFTCFVSYSPLRGPKVYAISGGSVVINWFFGTIIAKLWYHDFLTNDCPLSSVPVLFVPVQGSLISFDKDHFCFYSLFM